MTDRILQHLKVKQSVATVGYLQDLIIAYCRYVPWESVSKIVRKSLFTKSEDRVRLADEFWNSTLALGTGGTCYESNWAFLCLLRRLGFEGYLTINRIIDKSSIHSSLIVVIDGQKYIVDIGYPIYAPIPVNINTSTIVVNDLISYTCTAISEREYIIKNFPHPNPYLYHLTDIPVNPKDYLNIMCADHGEAGLFSDRIVIRKLINNIPTRFDSEDLPYNIHTLHHGQKLRTYLEGEDIINQLSAHFTLDHHHISRAFAVLHKRNAQAVISSSEV